MSVPSSEGLGGTTRSRQAKIDTYREDPAFDTGGRLPKTAKDHDQLMVLAHHVGVNFSHVPPASLIDQGGDKSCAHPLSLSLILDEDAQVQVDVGRTSEYAHADASVILPGEEDDVVATP